MDTRSAVWVPLLTHCLIRWQSPASRRVTKRSDWHGFFVWDHVNWLAPITSIADPSVTLAAIATATKSLTLGLIVTPPVRRLPVKVARETASLDRLSGGRLVLGAGPRR